MQVLAPAGEVLFFACPKKRTQKKVTKEKGTRVSSAIADSLGLKLQAALDVNSQTKNVCSDNVSLYPPETSALGINKRDRSLR